MPRSRVSFKERDLRRALRAAKKASVPVRRVEIDREGKIIIIPGTPAQPETNEWDEEFNGTH